MNVGNSGGVQAHRMGGGMGVVHGQGSGGGVGMSLHFSRGVSLLFPGMVTTSTGEYALALGFMIILGFLREKLSSVRVNLIFRPTSSNPNSRQERVLTALFAGGVYVYDLMLMLFAMSMNVGVIFSIGMGISLGHFYFADDTLNEMRKTVLASGCCA